MIFSRFCHLKSDKTFQYVHYSRNRTQMEDELLQVLVKTQIPQEIAKQVQIFSGFFLRFSTEESEKI